MFFAFAFGVQKWHSLGRLENDGGKNVPFPIERHTHQRRLLVAAQTGSLADQLGDVDRAGRAANVRQLCCS